MPPRNDRSPAEEVYRGVKSLTQRLLQWLMGPVRHSATVLLLRALHQLQRNMTPRRLLSFPHLLFGFWFVILMWGERWVFDSKVQSCEWANWEKWPKGTKPHHLIFVADPQIIDAHSYPGRPWPLGPLTILVTDNYLRRGYGALQSNLHPDSVFFLGDLFDGGREWKTRQGNFIDPSLGRPDDEKAWVDTWHRKNGEEYWLNEYSRFGDIYFNKFNDGGDVPGAWQRGRKLVASLPGNHDLGFGAQVQLSTRNRFSAYFGDVNRVDVVGNHTIVSVDGLSMSAGTSNWEESHNYKNSHDLEPIYGPVHEFLDGVGVLKRKAVQKELDAWHGTQRDLRFEHDVQELDSADLSNFPYSDPGSQAPDFPTILLTHVPLHREVGTPCGPQREHWPPSKPPKGQTEPVLPDRANALSITGGYQYQNVLSDEDSRKLVSSVGNVVHVFSGDDHDYCEVVHPEAMGGVREITVKSISMAMGVPTPGFVMASLYNPVDEYGKPVADAPEGTLQTHLCLLPNQIHTYMNYISFGIVTLVLCAVRAYLVPVFNLAPFALEPEKPSSNGTILPVFKDKIEPPDSAMQTTSSGTSAYKLPARLSATASRARSGSLVTNGGGGNGSAPSRWQSKKSRSAAGRWGWGGKGGPRINLDEAYYEGNKAVPRGSLGVVGRELWTTSWRVVWMAIAMWLWLVNQA